MKVAINRQLLGLEDLVFGEGSVTQIRGNQEVIITKINASNLPFDETRTLKQALEQDYSNIKIVVNSLGEIALVVTNLPAINTAVSNINAIKTVSDDLHNSCLAYTEDYGSIEDPIEVGNCSGTSAIETVASNITLILQAPVNAQLAEDAKIVAVAAAEDAILAVENLQNVYTRTEADALFVPLTTDFILDLGALDG